MVEVQPGAGNPFAGLGDPAGFIAARRAAIAAKVEPIYRDFKRTKRLPEGISYQGGSAFLVSGRDRPDLFDHAAALNIFLSQYNSGMNEYLAGGLVARGFRLEDFEIINALVVGPDYPDDVFKKFIDQIMRELPAPDREKSSDQAIRNYLNTFRQRLAKGLDAWAADVLNRFPLRARRILLSFAFEEAVPSSQMTRDLPLTDQDVRHFRYPDGAP